LLNPINANTLSNTSKTPLDLKSGIGGIANNNSLTGINSVTIPVSGIIVIIIRLVYINFLMNLFFDLIMIYAVLIINYYY
jgi:hypothetical protein